MLLGDGISGVSSTPRAAAGSDQFRHRLPGPAARPGAITLQTNRLPILVTAIGRAIALRAVGQTLIVDGGLTITDYPSQPWLKAEGAWSLAACDFIRHPGTRQGQTKPPLV
jgi:hypothetical protein